METITYQNIKVEGAPIDKITKLTISNSINTYGSAYVEGETAAGDAQNFQNKLTSGTIIKITTNAGGQHQVLFMGVVTGAGVNTEGEYTVIKLELRAMAAGLDFSRQNQSFQNTSSTYEEVIKKALKGKADLTMNVSDKAIGALIMRYNETDWAFAMRMASTFHAPLSANVETKKPHIVVGVPSTGKTYTINDAKYGFDSESKSSYGGTVISSYQYVYLGDKVSVSGNEQTVGRYKSELDHGILRTDICTLSNEVESNISSGSNPSPVGRQIMNVGASGKMFSGTVKAVKKDKVQVHLTSIDKSYDGGGNFWFPYSTAYSSSDGSGFYCMPAIGDTVRVFFPSDSEGDAFAASSVNVAPLDNPLHKKWRSPAGKEILFTPEGLLISCKDEKIFIDMTDEEGIKICSDKDITINAMNNLTVYAKNNLKMQAENKVLLSSGQAYIDMTENLIEMGANQIMIN